MYSLRYDVRCYLLSNLLTCRSRYCRALLLASGGLTPQRIQDTDSWLSSCGGKTLVSIQFVSHVSIRAIHLPTVGGLVFTLVAELPTVWQPRP